MGNRWLVAVAAIVAVVAVGGVGFATFTATAYLNGSGQAGTIGLAWGTDPGTAGSSYYVTCTATVITTSASDDTLNVVADNLAPGDYCAVSDTLMDTGSLPGGVYTQVTSVTETGCTTWYAADNWGFHTLGESEKGPIAISNSVPISYSLDFGLPSGSTGCAGSTVSYSEVFTAVAGT